MFIGFLEYPKFRAKSFKAQSLGELPEIFNFFIMAMKVIPSLEVAVKFTAFATDGNLASTLRKVLMKSIASKHSVESLLDGVMGELHGWGGFLERSYQLMKSSLSERDETARNIVLDRSLAVIMKGSEKIMEDFSRSLHMPVLLLYSLGIMIPLAIVAMIPAISVMGISITFRHVIIFYDIIVPVFIFIWAIFILSRRPVAFSKTIYPEKPGIATAGISTIVFTIFILIWRFHPLPFLPETSYLILSGIAPFSILAWSSSKNGIELLNNVSSMESELPDALFILGKRIGEGRPAEEAFIYMSRSMKDSSLGEIFRKASMKIMLENRTISQALFNSSTGVISSIPSRRIYSVLKLLVESMEKSGRIAGNVIIKTADHLRELERVETETRRALHSVISMMKGTALVFAPLIGGITVALADIINNMLRETLSKLENLPQTSTGFFSVSVNPPVITGGMYFLAIGIFIVLLTTILIWLTVGIEKGSSKVLFLHEISRGIPISFLIYMTTMVIAERIFTLILS